MIIFSEVIIQGDERDEFKGDTNRDYRNDLCLLFYKN
jgi:hypothetical protein